VPIRNILLFRRDEIEGLTVILGVSLVGFPRRGHRELLHLSQFLAWVTRVLNVAICSFIGVFPSFCSLLSFSLASPGALYGENASSRFFLKSSCYDSISTCTISFLFTFTFRTTCHERMFFLYLLFLMHNAHVTC